MGHTIVVGGTGMLKGVVEHLILQGFNCSVVARNRQNLENMHRHLGPTLHPLPVDYRDTQKFGAALNNVIQHFGPPEIVVNWIHSIAPETPFVLAEQVQYKDAKTRFFNILGSAAANPNAINQERRTRLKNDFHVDYREIILGFAVEDGYSRWLTHQEISAGVIEALEKDLRHHTVGQTEPWHLKP